jgi:hypothetical protein
VDRFHHGRRPLRPRRAGPVMDWLWFIAVAGAVVGAYVWMIRTAILDPEEQRDSEDREVERLDAIWDMPTFDPRVNAPRGGS